MKRNRIMCEGHEAHLHTAYQHTNISTALHYMLLYF